VEIYRRSCAAFARATFRGFLSVAIIAVGALALGGESAAADPTPTPRPTPTPLAALLASSPSCGQAVITATGVTAGLQHQIIINRTGGPSFVVNVVADASQKVGATLDLKKSFGGSGGGTFTVFLRMTSNQVTMSNTVTFTAVACPTPSPTATPTPTPTPATATATPVARVTPTQAGVARLPSTTTGGDSGLPISLAVIGGLALAAIAWRKRSSRT
jgi:hypothetical protein